MTDSPDGCSAPSRARHLPHRWSVMMNYLSGISAGDWWRLLKENRFDVDPAYWHRAAFITLLSLNNSWQRWREERRWGEAIARTKPHPAPLFILGHWRHGTTHLHNLLAQDDRFAYPTTFQVVNPHGFLRTEEVYSRRFAFLLPKTRPMDNMAMHFGLPQEDEFAPAILAGHSPYLGMSFPRREAFYNRFLSFREAQPAEREAWQNALLHFCRKLTFKNNRPLLLKSPPHTARLRWLLDLFPQARFVHIQREPFTVFQSSRHHLETALWYTYLQRPDLSRLEDSILQRYRTLYDAYFEDLPRIPAGQLHELRYEDLERDPIGRLRALYHALQLPDFQAAQPRMEAYLATIRHYRKNTHRTLSDALRERIASQWRRSFQRWGYAQTPATT